MKNILDSLSDEQKKPAIQTSGPVLVTAGAGSGKTRLLTHRIAHLVQNLSVSPYNILAITFTNKATNEMRDRLCKMIDCAAGMWIFTFHAMCVRILRTHADVIGFDSNFTIYGDIEKERIVKRLFPGEKTSSDIDSVCFHISNAKNKLFTPETYRREIRFDRKCDLVCDIYAKYQEELKLSNAMDFDDLLVKTYELFLNHPDILESYQNRFKYIHVDEFQDTNLVQYEIVKLLGRKHQNVFVVGDEDQCIYSWRGAEFANIIRFQKDFSDVKIFKLEQNYRSKKAILERANRIISFNTNRLEKKLWTENDEGDKVDYFVAYNDHEEAEWIAQKIKELVDSGRFEYKNIAVLMRVNALSRVVEEKFLNYSIPHQVYGGFKFYERREIKDVLAYLKLLSNPRDNDSFIRVLTFPKKGVGDVTISKILDSASKNSISAFDVIKFARDIDDGVVKKCKFVIDTVESLQTKIAEGLPMSEILKQIIDVFEIRRAIGNSSEEEVSRLMNIDNLLASVFEFENANPDSKIEDYLQSITLSRDVDNLDDKNNFVSIMTIHSAKGLEFGVVFVLGLTDGLLPISRAIYSESDSDLEEERRLMYVATTRAEDLLFYSRPNTRFMFETRRTENTIPSRFLSEAGFVETKKNFTNQKKSDFSAARSFFDDEDDEIEIKSDSTPKVSSEKIGEYMKFKRGSRVSHPNFGEGEVVVEVTDPSTAFITIRFDTSGIKTLSLKFAPLKLV